MSIQKEKKEPMVHVNLRIPKYVHDYYQEFPQPTVAMRDKLKRGIKNERKI